ncbi:MAG: hypothetical protein U1E05_04765 [Patescibacteria group bacterium]|nr:hypothetical protein [Patescibacteria group bacterium]
MNSKTVCYIAVLVLTAGLGAGCGGPVAAPTSFKNYQAKDQSFAIDYPETWEVKGGGQSGFFSARFTSGNASIKVTADTVGSLLGDIAGSQTGGMSGENEIPEERKPIRVVHEMGKEAMAEEWSGYEEAEPESVQTAFGDARLAEFTGKSTFGGEFRGLRLTALGIDRRITVVCCCQESDSQNLRPAFDKAIASLNRGG